MAKLTPWFPASVKPKREGVYQIRTADGIGLPWLSEYRRGRWLGTVGHEHVPAHASEFGREYGPTIAEITEWRGLAEAPEAKETS